MKISALFAVILLLPLTMQAELAPSVYEAMQAKAPDFLQIEILRVDTTPGSTPDQTNVQVVAQVTGVKRTADGLNENDIINIGYTVTKHPGGWVGPGEVPIPAEKDELVAYLSKTASGDFAPAAGRMTFSNF